MHITIRCTDAAIQVDCCIVYSEAWGHARGESIRENPDGSYTWAGTVAEFRSHWPSWHVWELVPE